MVCALSMYMGSSRNMDSASSNACNPPIQPYTIIPTHRQTDKLTWPLSAQGNTRNSLLYERNTSIKRGHLYVSYTTIQHTCMTSFCTSKYEEFKLLSLLRKSVKCTEQSLYTLSMEWITRLVINYLSFLDNSGYVCVCAFVVMLMVITVTVCPKNFEFPRRCLGITLDTDSSSLQREDINFICLCTCKREYA